jgi:hypothetical protein
MILKRFTWTVRELTLGYLEVWFNVNLWYAELIKKCVVESETELLAVHRSKSRFHKEALFCIVQAMVLNDPREQLLLTFLILNVSNCLQRMTGIINMYLLN